MEGAQGNSNAPPPFLTKTYEMVDDPMTNSMVSWNESGRSFIVWNPPEFSRDLLPQYFKHNNFSSFVRQLNTYGFRKIDPYQWEFANEEFIRGQKHLLKSIQRRKPVHSHSLHNQGNSYIALSGSEKKEFEEEIKRLNRDKIQLQLELQRNQSENQGFRYQIKLLSERFQDIDHRQRQLVTFLAQLLQKPESAAILEQQSLLHYKKRRLLDSDQFFSKSDKEEYLSLPGQDGSQVSVRSPALNMEEVERLESSLELLETVLQGADNTLNGARGLGVSSHTSEILVTEVHDFCGERDTDEEQCSLISPLSSPHHPMDMNSSPDLACSVCCVESPPSPCLSINFDVEAKSSETDANSQPSSDPEGEALKEKLSEKADSPSSPPPPAVKENDNFWAQFLTENPSSTDSRSGDGLIDGKPQDHRKAWWNTGNVDDLTKHMKHLSSAENMA